jgi:hypothetical protein
MIPIGGILLATELPQQLFIIREKLGDRREKKEHTPPYLLTGFIIIFK